MPAISKRSDRPPDGAALRTMLGFITQEELCALFRMKRGTVANRQTRGEMPPSYKVGRTRLYKLTEVEAWIKRRAGGGGI